LRNKETAIASALGPRAMVIIPPLTPLLLPRAVRLPGSLRRPPFLLLPGSGLFLGTLGLLLLGGRLGTLRLLRLRHLGPLLRWLFGLLLRLRFALRRLRLRRPMLRRLRLLSGLCPLQWLCLLLLNRLGLLLGWLCMLLGLGCLLSRPSSFLGLRLPPLRLLRRLRVLLLLRLSFPSRLGPLLLLRFLALLLFGRLAFPLLLRVQEADRPDNQKQSGGAGRSSQLHGFVLR
jgi:hypothetical protein